MRRLLVLFAVVGALVAGAPTPADAGVAASRMRFAVASARSSFGATILATEMRPSVAGEPGRMEICVKMNPDGNAEGCVERAFTIDPLFREAHLKGTITGTLHRFLRWPRTITLVYDITWRDMSLLRPSGQPLDQGCEWWNKPKQRTVGAIVTLSSVGHAQGVMSYDFDGYHEVRFTDASTVRAELGHATEVTYTKSICT